MAWEDYDKNTELERDVLARAVPLVPLARASGALRVTLDAATGQMHTSLVLGDVIGPTPDACVSLLRLRPLMFGTAWKVLDLFLEECFLQAGEQFDSGRGFSIRHKRSLARRFTGAPAFLPLDIFQAAALSYDQTAQVRDSLVHRRVHTDPTNALVGRDAGGGNLRPVTSAEQEAFVRAALRLSEAAIAQGSDARTNADLRAHFEDLSDLHGVTMSIATAPVVSVPILTIIVDPEASGRSYALDIPYIRRRNPSAAMPYADIVVEFRDRPGQALKGRLEDAPDQVLFIDPDEPPAWLR